MGMCETTEASARESFMKRRGFKEEQSLSKSGFRVLEGHRKCSVDSNGFWITLQVERKDGASGRGRLWGHWNAAGNRWRKPRGEKGWNTEVKPSAFIRIMEKKNLQEGLSCSLGEGNGGRRKAGG